MMKRKIATFVIAVLLLFSLVPTAAAISAIEQIGPGLISPENYESASYLVGDEAEPLSAGLLAVGEAIQWQVFLESGTGWTDIPGATSTAYTPPTDTPGKFLYRSEIINNGTREASDSVVIYVLEIPVLTLTPAKQDVFYVAGQHTYIDCTVSGDTNWNCVDGYWACSPTPDIADKKYIYDLQYSTTRFQIGHNMDEMGNFIGTTYWFKCFVYQDPLDPSKEIEAVSNAAKVTISFTNPFTDITYADWFYTDVLFAQEMGLIDGISPTSFSPNGNLTIAQAIKLAACMHQYYNTEAVTLVNGTKNWYDTYVDYAIINGLLSSSTYEGMYNDYATRAQYIEIFFYALPNTAYPGIQVVPSGAIPDVSISDYYGYEVYTFYRAGILRGNDAAGSFAPESYIRRCEVAAIITRMLDPNTRITEPYGWAN